MISKRRAWLTCCVYPSSVGQRNQRQQGILHCWTFAGCCFYHRIAGRKRYNLDVPSSLCARPRAITSPFLQIPNYLTFGPTEVQEMIDTECGSPLPITHVMWCFDTHLHYLKKTKGSKPSFVFIDHPPDLVCKIAAIEPDSRMYFLGVSINSLSDWVNRVQNQLNHVSTQGSKLDESGDWDQQANWTNCGILLWVRDEKYGSDALTLNEGEILQKGQAAEAEVPAGKADVNW